MNCYLFQTTREIDDMWSYIGWRGFVGQFKSYKAAKEHAEKMVNEGVQWVDGFQLVGVLRSPYAPPPEILEIGETYYNDETNKYYVRWEKCESD